jgi:hypothetical protein
LSWSVDEELEEPLDGVLAEPLDGVLDAPAPAAPPDVLLEGEELDEDAPPLAGLLVVSLEPELEELEGEDALPEGELVEPEDDALPEGELDGEELVPLPDIEEDDEPEGDVVEPEGEVVLDDEAPGPRSLPRLQPVTTAVPSARVTASAKVETLMRPPW